MVVPQTPLHTARVLQEDKDHWDEVKVSAVGLSLPAGAPGWWLLRAWVFVPCPVPGAQAVSDCTSGPSMAHRALAVLPLFWAVLLAHCLKKGGLWARGSVKGLWP